MIGAGTENELMPVPSLFGMTYSEAKAYLEGSGIALGAVIPEGVLTDTASAYVFKQRPETVNVNNQPVFIKSGQLMDIWISQVMKLPPDSIAIKNKIP